MTSSEFADFIDSSEAASTNQDKPKKKGRRKR